MVAIDSTDSTTNVTRWHNSTTSTGIIHTFYYNEPEYVPDYIAEEIEEMRSGWY